MLSSGLADHRPAAGNASDCLQHASMNAVVDRHVALPPPPETVAVPRRQDAVVIGLVALAHAASHFAHLLLVPLFSVFMRDFGLSYSDIGLLMTIFFIISGTGQAMAVFVVYRGGVRPARFLVMICFLFASLAAAMVRWVWRSGLGDGVGWRG